MGGAELSPSSECASPGWLLYCGRPEGAPERAPPEDYFNTRR